MVLRFAIEDTRISRLMRDAVPYLAGGRESSYVGLKRYLFFESCYLNIPCLRINITLKLMSSSSNKLKHK